ncbi:hypothetical protein HDU93_002935 [Gonapodya sp. JEL0774]|nr:hypothetical protein HDU93_002935 [Gonapodya sp. JEL0774]
MALMPPNPSMGPPMGMPPPFPFGAAPPGAPTAPIIERRIPKDVRLTVYIGQITDGVTDEHLEKLLRVRRSLNFCLIYYCRDLTQPSTQLCGPIRAWKRLQDATNKVHPAGLAEFENLEGMRKCEILLANGQFGGKGIELPDPKAGIAAPENGQDKVKTEPKPLMVTAGDSAKMALEEFKRTYKLDENEVNRLRGDLEAILNSIRTSLSNRPSSPELLDSHGDPVSKEVRDIYKRIAATTREVNQTLAQLFPGLQPDELDDLPPDQIMENQELVLKEIATFRRQQARRELEKRTEIDRADRSRKDDEERRKDIAAGLTPEYPNSKQPDGWVRGGSLATGDSPFQREVASAAGAVGDNVDDEEEEARKEARRQKEMEIAFRDREKRWEMRESARFRKFDQDELRDREDEIRASKSRDIMERRLREFDDDYEREQQEYEWFRDRQRWIERRRLQRNRERADDEHDRQLEAEELAAEQRAEAEAMQAVPSAAVNGNGAMPVTLEVDKFLAKYQLTGDQMRERDRERDHRDGVPAQPFAPPPGSAPVGRIMTTDERKRAQTELVDEIPAAREPLFGWRLRWEVLDEGLLTTKLRSFISRKLQSLLGEEVPDIADHVVDHLRKRKSPEALWDEMKQVLDEESERFVCLVWRMLVFETESRVRGL